MEEKTDIVLNDKRVINGWALFDWANSAFALVITVAIFPGYYLLVVDDEIRILGATLPDETLYAYAISASYLLIAAFSPLLSGIADYGGKRKFFLKFFTTLGALSCLSLFFFQGMDQFWLGNIAFVLAMIGFAGGLVFYNAYLPVIASEDQYDRVSARGFAFGYIGSVLLLIINLAIILLHEQLGIGEMLAMRLSFLLVGLWWLGFSTIPFRRLPPDPEGAPGRKLMQRGLAELGKVWQIARQSPNIMRFLIAFFFYSAGVQTVLFLAATFADTKLQLERPELILLILLLQVVAVFGAYFFSRISEQRGNKFSLMAMLAIWMVICVAGYLVETKALFFTVAGAIGLVMGGIQSLSRSTYSKLLPENTPDTTSFFSFYDVLEKVAIVLGTSVFGFVGAFTGNPDNSILILTPFFAISLFVIARITIQPAPGKEILPPA